MTYAFLLLAALAFFGWMVLGGVPAPDIQEDSIRAHIAEAYTDLKERTSSFIKNAAKQQLHKAVDETLD